MASTMRPALLRQAFNAAPSRISSRAMSTVTTSALGTSPIARQQLRSTFQQDALPVSRIAAFHGSGRKEILPPLPQRIKGTLNDPAPVPDPTPTHGSYHWTFERLVAASLVPLTVAPFAAGSLNPVMDATLAALIIIHSHIGFESCIIDYFPAHRVPGIRKALMWILKIFTVIVAAALYQFETHDVGLTAAIARVWRA